jgi:hypothetical protein
MVDVFISYSRTNREIVARLAEAVKGEGYALWWDEELPPHLSYGDVITEKIGSAKAAIVVWSRPAAASEWVRAEADVARNQKKLIQVSVDDSMPPLPFNQIQFASIADWQGEPDHPGWRKVKASLKALCGEPESAGRPPPPPSYSPPPPPVPPTQAVAQPPQRGGAVAGWIGVGMLVLIVVAGALLWVSRQRHRPRPAPIVEVVAPPEAPAAAPTAVVPARPAGRFVVRATIQDPDGYTNLRASASPQSAILARVEEGEVFTTFRQPGLWWQVRTADGTIGYMHRSRIRLAGAGR